MQVIKLNNKHFRKISAGDSYIAFFCHEEPKLRVGAISIGNYFDGTEFKGIITNIYSKPLSKLMPEELLAGGYQSSRLLSYDLAMQYTRFIKSDDIITLVCFTITSDTVYNVECRKSIVDDGYQSTLKLVI